MSGIMQMLLASGGGVPAGTYATWNPSDKASNVTLSNGNLTYAKATGAPPYGLVRATVGKTTGKWYWEITLQTSGEILEVGLATSAPLVETQDLGANIAITTAFSYFPYNGNVYTNAGVVATWTAAIAGDVMGVAVDFDAATFKLYKNNSLLGTYSYSLSGTIYAAICCGGSAATNGTANFGATALTYTPPAGYNAGLYT